jgi:hypothetical protein
MIMHSHSCDWRLSQASETLLKDAGNLENASECAMTWLPTVNKRLPGSRVCGQGLFAPNNWRLRIEVV